MINFNFIAALFFSLFISSSLSNAQTTIWSDNFNNGCANNCLASTYGGWTIQNNIGGTSGSASNNWYISCAEEGITPPGCGSSCVGDASLHIGANSGAGGDMAAGFNETGAVNATYKLVVSPLVNTTGYSTIVLKFDYIAYGSAACSEDRAQLWLSNDGGTTWPVGWQYCLNSVCCGACNGYSQGQWTAYSLSLPASFNNNPNVRIGFHWRNNGNGSGTEPSVAIDDIKVIQDIPAPLNLLNFSASNNAPAIVLNWKSTSEENFSHYEVQRSLDATNFKSIATVKGKCNNSTAPCYYSYEDLIVKEIVYYRLKMVDLDNSFSYSSIITNTSTNKGNDLVLVSSAAVNDQLTIQVSASSANKVNYSIYDSNGKWILSKMNEEVKPGMNQCIIDISGLTEGIYLLKLYGQYNAKFISGKFLKTKY